MMRNRRSASWPSPRGARLRARLGAGLIEVMLAITIFALVASSHARVTLLYAIRVKEIKTGAQRSAALQEYITRLMAIPFDSIPARVGCTTTTTGELPSTRCITYDSISTTLKRVRLIQTPTSSAFKPDTVTVWRSRIYLGAPLGT